MHRDLCPVCSSHQISYKKCKYLLFLPVVFTCCFTLFLLCSKLHSEKEDLWNDLEKAHSQIKQQTKELKDALSKSKRAMDEVQEVNDRLADVRSQRQKNARNLREKEEEVDDMRQQITQLKQDVRKADKTRKAVSSIQNAILLTLCSDGSMYFNPRSNTGVYWVYREAQIFNLSYEKPQYCQLLKINLYSKSKHISVFFSCRFSSYVQPDILHNIKSINP